MARAKTKPPASHNRYSPPYLPWYEGDFSGNQSVRLMAPICRLMYRSLLQAAWQTRNAPYLPADDAMLRQLADAPSVEVWEEHKAVILGMFQKDGESFYHPKTLRLFHNVMEVHKAKVQGGKQGGAKRWGREGSNGNGHRPKVSAVGPGYIKAQLEAEANL